MADYSDVQLTTFTNGRTRTLADQLVSILIKLQAYQSDYVAQSVAVRATAAGANNLADGYVTDGRQPITGTQVGNFKACVDQIVTAMATTNVIGVGSPISTTVNAIQVNGSSR